MPSNADYAKINIACKELGLDKYQLIGDRYGVDSSKELSPRQVHDLLTHFKSLGWKQKQKVKKGRAGRVKSASYINIKPGPAAKQQRYVVALWNALGYEPAKLHSRVKKQFGVERFEWVTEYEDLHVLITDLVARCNDAGIGVNGRHGRH